ncbi:hypothetical protein BJP24_19955 [Aeromonas allosaccharophila]|uniref:glycosyltransferase family 2 protein n=1 Tax=Aeromonas allosaccharophila TaxID=656 RepID=UPI00095A4EAC|nr:glycosyltransferase family 2 protein [Aeromonas allosaccharophila]OKP42009.1 hypothetical protein BJP24_19955 [Aeromonas allosaccharophila]
MISIIILNYNSTDYTISCINSIFNSSHDDYEVIVVDNGSSEEQFVKLSDFVIGIGYKKVTLERNVLNFGFALGNIVGILKAKGKYIFVLNNDTLIEKNTLKVLNKFMDDHDDVSLCIPSQYDEKGIYHPSFAYIPSVLNQWFGSGFCRFFDGENYPDRKKIYHEPVKVPMGSGASMFFRTKDYYDVGGLDPNYFLYCEEEDICIRMKKRGMKVFFVPEAKIIHFCGGSTNRNIEIEKEFYISLFYFFSKNYNLLASVALKSRFLLKAVIKTVRKPNINNFKILFFLLRSPSLSLSLRHRQHGIIKSNF